MSSRQTIFLQLSQIRILKFVAVYIIGDGDGVSHAHFLK